MQSTREQDRSVADVKLEEPEDEEEVAGYSAQVGQPVATSTTVKTATSWSNFSNVSFPRFGFLILFRRNYIQSWSNSNYWSSWSKIRGLPQFRNVPFFDVYRFGTRINRRKGRLYRLRFALPRLVNNLLRGRYISNSVQFENGAFRMEFRMECLTPKSGGTPLKLGTSCEIFENSPQQYGA